MKLDILAIAAHPDDVELSCSGILIKHIKMGKKVGIIDLTQGELGTRGTPELRLKEAEKAAQIMGISARVNMGFKDGFFQNDETHQRALIAKIRKYQPEIVITNTIKDRHPDHYRASQLVKESAFYAGLRKIETIDDGEKQAAWRPTRVAHFIQHDYIEPSLIIDVTEEWEVKKKAIQAYQSQFFDPDSSEPETYISSSNFMKFIESRSRALGQKIGAAHGEGLLMEKLSVNSLFDLT